MKVYEEQQASTGVPVSALQRRPVVLATLLELAQSRETSLANHFTLPPIVASLTEDMLMVLHG
jgi:hypothetical protein